MQSVNPVVVHITSIFIYLWEFHICCL